MIDWADLVTIIETISDKKQVVLADFPLITNVILPRFAVSSESLRQLWEIFQATSFYQTENKLRAMQGVHSLSVYSLASQIDRFLQSSVSDGGRKPVGRSNVESFSKILQQLVPLTPRQWSVARRAIEIIGGLLCDAVRSTVNVSTIVVEVLRFLGLVQPEKDWSSIQQSFAQLGSTPTWQITTDFVKRIGCREEIIRLVEAINT